MSKEIESELDRILARDSELRAAEESKKAQNETVAAAAAVEWKSRVESVLLPAIEPLSMKLRESGWTCIVGKTPGGFNVSAYRGDMMTYASRQRPSISFEIQKGWGLVAVHEATPSGVGNDSNSLHVDVAPDVICKRILEFIAKLARK